MTQDRRCPNCGALVSAEAEWCGQCFTSLRAPAAEPKPMSSATDPVAPERAEPTMQASGAETAPAEDAGTAGPRSEAFWPCTVCGARNPIDLDACTTCGTPFAAVMRGTARRTVDPHLARTRSLLFPGAGHALLGYSTDGFARGALFALSLAVAIFLAVTVPRSSLTLFAIAMLVACAVGIYILSLAETRQLSEHGGGMLVPSKILLWGAVGVMFLIVVVIGLSIVGNARR